MPMGAILAWMCTTCLPSALRGKKRVMDPLE